MRGGYWCAINPAFYRGKEETRCGASRGGTLAAHFQQVSQKQLRRCCAWLVFVVCALRSPVNHNKLGIQFAIWTGVWIFPHWLKMIFDSDRPLKLCSWGWYDITKHAMISVLTIQNFRLFGGELLDSLLSTEFHLLRVLNSFIIDVSQCRLPWGLIRPTWGF